MLGEFPADLRADLQSEVARIVNLLQEMGWSIDVVGWQPTSDAASERRISFIARKSGNSVHSTCAESSLPTRLLALLGLKPV
jgi:hypothetical protein